MTRLTLLCVAVLSVASSASGLEAQVRLPVQPPIRQLDVPVLQRRDSQPVVPTAYRPPPGMCRIWLEGVPPGQQPAPTDCASAVRNRPSNGRVIFGDDYVKRGKNDRKDRRPSADSQADGRPVAFGEIGQGAGASLALFAAEPRVHGPAVEAELGAPTDVVFAPEAFQPPTRRPTAAPAPRARPAVAADDDDDDDDAQPRDPRSLSARRAADRRDRRDSIADASRRRREDFEARRRPADRDDARREGTHDGARPGDRRTGEPGFRDGVRDRRDGATEGRDDGRYADGRSGYGRYPSPYDPRYAPGRANGTCLDRDGDGWCDDYRTGGGYCVDRDGDGRCDDYPGLASAPYSSALPPMRAAADVARGYGSDVALRWLGTAEVTVRTTDLRRTGSPTRAMWLDANTGRLLQVWTDRNGDGIADRVEIYRNGQVVKTIGR